MQQRYYDPVIGRFYSNDPVGFTTSNPMMFNRYAYANNNPYKYVNPDGQLGMLSTAFVGGLISGGLELGKQLYEGEVGKECQQQSNSDPQQQLKSDPLLLGFIH